LTVLVMVPIGYLIRQSIRLLGYTEPGDAPIVLQYAALTVTLMTLVIILHFATDDAYKELQKRRQKERESATSIDGHEPELKAAYASSLAMRPTCDYR
jgi:hypothetical protein